MKHKYVLVLVFILLSIPTLALADAPTEGRAGRAEVRFMQGMIDHHQMAIDMANHCLTRASTDEVREICAAVIAAQTPEIEMMQGWLAEWYGVSYTPMSMLGSDHSEHDATEATAGDHSDHAQSSAASPGMGMDMPMMGGMGGMGMQGMMMQQMQNMHSMMMMMHMQSMMMQIHGMMQGMNGMGNMPDMGGANTMPGMGMDGMELRTDPSMTMGMLAGLDRAQGIDYDITWLEAMIDHHDDAIHMAERSLEHAEHPGLIELAQAIISAQTAENAQMEALIETLSNA